MFLYKNMISLERDEYASVNLLMDTFSFQLTCLL